MSLFEKLFPKAAVDAVTTSYFRTLTGYQPVFKTFNGGIYEAELCRASIHAIATHCSKLKPEVYGVRQDLQKVLEFQPNPYMDTTKFLYKLATIVEVENTAFVVPIFDKYYEKIIGFYPVSPKKAEVREKNGKTYLVFEFAEGQKSALEFDKVGILTKFFYAHDFFGEDNKALLETINLLSTQNQGMAEGIKQSAAIRFLGRVSMPLKDGQIEALRARWNKANLSIDNQGGIAIADSAFADIKQIDSKPYTIDKSQMDAVKENVYDYFGVNTAILQNTFTPDQWAAFYEAKIEPFAIQLSLVMSNMLYTAEQKVRGNQVMFTANRLQYASVDEKLRVVAQLTDRGMMNRNEGREVFNLGSLGEEGEAFIIRGEYYNADEKVSDDQEDNNNE